MITWYYKLLETGPGCFSVCKVHCLRTTKGLLESGDLVCSFRSL